ncbi:ArsR family transcriptional regulator [Bacillus thuringiensis Sbt003]|uniref:ArsR family transcriptional regulator n=1 Tax=Bacillus thuringiensis Sbt003 TaxID=1235825 RepID=A0A9X0F4I8_BACTU|nr:ArsR family transcriptional regulator [Bacillus cereus]KIU71872.1 ArsR family transcriptional regulator [Bacillus thuringiensis Sbt003]
MLQIYLYLSIFKTHRNFHPKMSFYKNMLIYLFYLHPGLFSYNFFTLGLFFCNNYFLFFKFLVCIVWYNSSHGGGKEHVRNLSKRIRTI